MSTEKFEGIASGARKYSSFNRQFLAALPHEMRELIVQNKKLPDIHALERDIKRKKAQLGVDFPPNIVVSEQDQRNLEFRRGNIKQLQDDLQLAKEKKTKRAEAGDRGLAYFRDNCGPEIITIINAAQLRYPAVDSFRLLYKVRKECKSRFAGDVRVVWGEIKQALDDLECVSTKTELSTLVAQMEALRVEQVEYYNENNAQGAGVLPDPMADPEAILHLRARIDSDSRVLTGLVAELDKRNPTLNTWNAVVGYCHWFCGKNVSNVNKRTRSEHEQPSSAGAPAAHIAAAASAAASASAASAAAVSAASAAEASAYYGQQMFAFGVAAEQQQTDPYQASTAYDTQWTPHKAAGYVPQPSPAFYPPAARRGSTNYRGAGRSYPPRGMPPGYEQQVPTQPCFNFWRFGTAGCLYGDSCRYSHDVPPQAHAGGTGPAAAPPPANNNDRKPPGY